MFTQRRRKEIEDEIAELQTELNELTDTSQLFKTLRTAFGEKDWEQHVIDGYVTSEEGPDDYRPDIRFKMCLELHETLVDWTINVTGKHSDFDITLKVKYNKNDDSRYEEILTTADIYGIKNPDDRNIVHLIFSTHIPDYINFIWNL